MVWEEVTALMAVAGGIACIHAFTTQAIVAKEIRKLNGTYLRTELADAKFKQIEEHFDYVRDQLDPLTKMCPLLYQDQLEFPQMRQGRHHSATNGG